MPPIPGDGAAPAGDAASGGVGMAVGMPTIDETIRRIFLSPRVIDQRSADELSESLRGLVRDAAAQGRSLAATASEVKGLGGHLREATQQLRERVETAARVVPGIDERVAKVETLLNEAGRTLGDRLGELRAILADETRLDRAAIAEQVRAAVGSAVDSIVAGAVGQVEARGLAAEESVKKRAAELHTAGATIQAAVASALRAVEQKSADVDRAGARQRETLQSNLTAGLAALDGALRGRLDDLDQRAAAADGVLTGRARAAWDTMNGLDAQIDARVSACAARVDAMLRAAEARIADAVGVLDGPIARAEAAAGELDEAVRRALESADAVERRIRDRDAEAEAFDRRLADFRAVSASLPAEAERAVEGVRAEAARELEGVRAAVAGASKQAEDVWALVAGIDVGQARRCADDTNDAAARATEAALQLRELAARASATEREVRASLDRMEAARTACESQRAALAESLEAGAAWLDSMRDQAGSLAPARPRRAPGTTGGSGGPRSGTGAGTGGGTGPGTGSGKSVT